MIRSLKTIKLQKSFIFTAQILVSPNIQIVNRTYSDDGENNNKNNSDTNNNNNNNNNNSNNNSRICQTSY